jgi:hypothetical protein
MSLLLPLLLIAQPALGDGKFDQTLTLQGIQFHVTSANQGSVNALRIVPSGRIARRTPIEQEIMGSVTGAEIADLNADGWPEIYVYVTSAGSGSYGTVVGYAVNRGKSVTPIYFPDLADDPVASKGYMGHDEFSIIEATLARRFPLYKVADSNGTPSGGKRQLAYRLKAGEAGWVLRLDKTKALDF